MFISNRNYNVELKKLTTHLQDFGVSSVERGGELENVTFFSITYL